MKKITFLLFVLGASFSMKAQVKTPAPSPAGTVTQTIGLTEATVKYSRPSMKGRTIFGGLQAYGELWRTGANKNTTITFGDDVTISGKELKAGSYAIFTKPGKETWEVFFYTNTDNWGTPEEWDESKVAVKVTAKVFPMPVDIETFTITFDDLTSNSAVLGLMWERAYIGVKIDVPTAAKAMKSIESAMAGPSAGDYFSAASYYFDEGKDLNKAKEWVDKAVSMDDKAFWVMRKQSLIYAKLGDKKGAITAAKKSLEAAKAAKNDHYVKLNTASLKEWGAK